LTLANGGGTNFADVGGAIRNAGVLSLEECVFTGNRSAVDGGAIHNDGGTLTILNSTLSGNASGSEGGAIHGGTMALTNCTLTGNTAVNGGAIRGAGSMTLTHCTVSGNTATGGGGVDNLSSIELNFSIVAGNSPDNLTGGFTGTQNLTSGDPLLSPLLNFEGPTLTMALMPGSPARNAATNSTESADQRGFLRDSTPDIGAYEAGASGRSLEYNQFIWESLPTTNVAAHDPAVDYDGDGASNNDEWRAATDPGNADSVFRILSITPDNGTNYLIRIPTATLPGNTDYLAYTLYYSDVLPAMWTNDLMANPSITGDGTIQTFTNTPPPEATNRFYRVLVGPGRSR
jgi:predicted outer membrane repeat protein